MSTQRIPTPPRARAAAADTPADQAPPPQAPEAAVDPVVATWWEHIGRFPEWAPRGDWRVAPDGRVHQKERGVVYPLRPAETPGVWVAGRPLASDPAGDFRAIGRSHLGRLGKHERVRHEGLEAELRQLEADGKGELAAQLRAKLDRPRASDRRDGDLFDMGTIWVDRRLHEFFDVGELVDRHCSGDFGEHGKAAELPPPGDFARWCRAAARPGEGNLLAIETGSGLVQSRYVRDVPGRGPVRCNAYTLLRPGLIPETLLEWTM